MGTNYYAGSIAVVDSDAALHIGKNSAGWRFCFQAYPHHDEPLVSWAAWRHYLAECPIFDEYGRPVPFTDLARLVEADPAEKHCAACEAIHAGGPPLYASAPGPDYHDADGHPFYAGDFC